MMEGISPYKKYPDDGGDKPLKEDIPGTAIEDHRRVPLDVGLRLFRLCPLTGTNQEATFPSHESKFRTSKSFDAWLKGAYAKDSQRASVHPSVSIVDVSK
ncbi:hypothetical protein LIER_24838 [Lithospermum erythrorhizon]|uniref:Uncharacterized protein n=1 Tax=Lithospermum erythrorhizon TaxID=34254 RepID=A0AAV3R2L8_LITER